MYWGLLGGYIWDSSYDDLATYGKKIALSYDDNNLKTPIF